MRHFWHIGRAVSAMNKNFILCVGTLEQIYCRRSSKNISEVFTPFDGFHEIRWRSLCLEIFRFQKSIIFQNGAEIYNDLL